MMLEELSIVLDKVGDKSVAKKYVAAIVDENILGKATQATRERTAKRLVELYSLDPNTTLFRLLRRFWAADQAGRPMLAFLAAIARDPLLRDLTPFILAVPRDAEVNSQQVGDFLAEKYPGRFRQTTLLSTAQNIASTWTQAGYLRGKVKKHRSSPKVTPPVAAFALVLGYLCGLRGKLLLHSVWTRLLDRTSAEITELAGEASKQGWLNFKAVGAVVEITFPDLLLPHEQQAANESD